MPRPSTFEIRSGLPLLALLVACEGGGDGAAGNAPPGWTGEVRARIRASEYALQTDETGISATNRRHDLRARFDADGVAVSGRAHDREVLHLRFAAWGRSDALTPVIDAPAEEGDCDGSGALDAFGDCLRRVHYVRPGVVEWWANREDGLEQGFTVTGAPAGDGPLRLLIAVEGAVVDADGDAAVLVPAAGPSYRYGGLHAWDERGRDLPVALEVTAQGLELQIDDEGAYGTLTVDPLLTSEAWSANVGQSSADFGASVATAGDVNGDGYADVVIGAPYYDNGNTNEGRAYVYQGSATGLATTASWTTESNRTNALYAESVASAGDVNGDGFGDVIVGEPAYSSGVSYQGRAYVYLGSATGLATTAAWTEESGETSARFGSAVASAGDVNADGYDDIAVGAPSYSGGESGEGRVYVYLGSSAGLATSASWTTEPNVAGAQAGAAVRSAGDVNNDGYSDLIVGMSSYTATATLEGRAEVYLGSATGLAASAAWAQVGGAVDTQYGVAVAAAGDVDGDGYGDIIVGADGYNDGHNGAGKAFVYLGSASGPSTTPAWSVEGDQTSAYLGYSVDGAGDVDGDGYADVVVGAPGMDGYATSDGVAMVFFGSADGLEASPDWTGDGGYAAGSYGASVAAAGDVNGDGYSDVLIADPDYEYSPMGGGLVRIYLGAGRGLLDTAAWTGESDQLGGLFGWSVDGAGDVNGDGYADVIVGAYSYDNGETDEGRAFAFHGSAAGLSTVAAWTAEPNQASAKFGYSVSRAGDVNRDGYGDVIVGAPAWDGGQSDEGAAFVYLGSAAGLSSSAAWTAEANQAGAAYGWAVADAGDVNGDRYGDIVVGSYLYTNGETYEGRAWVYHGSAGGPATSASWTGESNVNRASFAFSVASAGDVDGDRFDDLLVGDPGYSGFGRVFLFRGSAGGLASSAAWTMDGDYGELWGWSVGGAGDLDGDGYDDVVIGGPEFSNGENYEGRVLVFMGEATGLATTPAAQLEADVENGGFGISVDGAGDIDGDGYADLVVGADYYEDVEIREGGAFVYLGSASGLVTAASWTGESDQDYASYGISVAGAGDVNGDGYDDVIVGAHSYYAGESDEGRAWVYYGRAPTTFYVDEDGDGYGDPLLPTVTATGTILPGYAARGEDCDDAERTVHPGAPELCDGAGVDEDCDGLVDDDDPGLDEATTTTAYADADGDGHGGPVSAAFCVMPVGYVATSTDCMDSDPEVHPGASEADAEGTDADCDETVSCYQDADGDGYRTSTLLEYSTTPGATGGCSGEGRATATAAATDCADDEASVNPGQIEVCDGGGVDEDCNGLADDDDAGVDPVTRVTSYADVDGDGYGGGSPADFCDPPGGYADDSTDCADLDAAIHPGATDTAADGTDSDCDASEACYQDADGDAWRTETLLVYVVTAGTSGACSVDGRAIGSMASSDCDDGDAGVNPGETEVCDTADVDEDCDGAADGTDASTLAASKTVYYQDVDGDGYGGAVAEAFCELPPGYVSASTDCRDGDAAVNPGAAEVPGDGIDGNCDGVDDCYVDADADGYRSADEATVAGTSIDCSGPGEADADAPGGDCDDLGADVHPGGSEVVGDEADGDCDGGELCFPDEDADGYRPDGGDVVVSDDLACDGPGEGSEDVPAGDCDDEVTDVHPGAPEECNTRDDDCDGQVDEGCGDTAGDTDTGGSVDDETGAAPDPADSGGDTAKGSDEEGCGAGCASGGGGDGSPVVLLIGVLVLCAGRRGRGCVQDGTGLIEQALTNRGARRECGSIRRG